jgi:predicted Zn-dependent peptidase
MNIPIERFAIANGLRVVLSQDRSTPVVAVNLWYNVGSRNERPGRTGFAHLFEHMMFQGSQNVPDTQHIAHVEHVGGAVNGSTWLDRTNYYETVPAHQLELALWLESDRMGFLLPAMTQEKLDNQRDVVKNERRWRVDNRPYGDWDEKLQALVFPPDHAYHHSVIGSMADLDAASLDDVQEFFRTFYAPNNAVLAICGDFDSGAARVAVERYFGPIPHGPPLPPIPGPAFLPLPSGEEVRETVHAEVGLPRLYLAFRIPAYGTDHFYPLDVASHVLGHGKSSRLYRSLVREQRIAQDVAAFAFPLVHGAAMLVMWATVARGKNPAQVEAALLHEVAALAENAADQEVERAITGIDAHQTIGLQQVGERADQLAMFTTLWDDPDHINTELDRYRAVSAAAVRQAAARFFGSNNRVVLWYLPRATEAV